MDDLVQPALDDLVLFQEFRALGFGHPVEVLLHLGADLQDRPLVVHCAAGFRAHVATRMLLQAGWTDVRNLDDPETGDERAIYEWHLFPDF